MNFKHKIYIVVDTVTIHISKAGLVETSERMGLSPFFPLNFMLRYTSKRTTDVLQTQKFPGEHAPQIGRLTLNITLAVSRYCVAPQVVDGVLS